MPGEAIEIEHGSRQEVVVSAVDLNKDHSVNDVPALATDAEPELPKKDGSQSKDVNDDKKDDLDLSCGIGGLRTNIFGSKFANLYSFAICFGLANLFAAMVSQVIQVQLTSLERQFNIDNARAGLFETVSRIGYISTLLFAGHFAKQYHMPMIIGVSGVIQGLVLTIPAIMQFVDPYRLPVLPPAQGNNSSHHLDAESSQYTCDGVGLNETIEERGEVKQLQFIVVLIVQTIKGLTDTLHNGVLPILYMDDNMLKKSQMGIMIGIWQILAELSGPIGKQINGVLSEVPIDLIATDMDPKDRRFVSAWWLAFLVFGLGTAVFSLPIMLFPRSLVSDRQKSEALKKAVVTFAGGEVADEVLEPVEGMDQKGEAPRENGTTTTIEVNSNELPESDTKHYNVSTVYARSNSRKSSNKGDLRTKKLSVRRSSSLFPPVVGPTERKVSITGDLIFDQPIKRQDSMKAESLIDLIKDFPKALIRVMSKPVFLLSLIDIAIVSVPYSGTAIFRNTYMVNEYNVTMPEVAFITGISTAVGMISGTIISSWLSSRVNTKIGYALITSCTWVITLIIIPFFFVLSCDNQVVYGSSGEFGREANLTNCNCTLSHQLISCGADGINYISPCYAGCSKVDGKYFTDCTLLNATLGSTVTPGLCTTDCRTNFIIYCTLQGALNFFYFVSMIPRRLLVLRIVDPQDRGFATSLFNFSFVLIGIPSSNLFGGIIDGTCLIWDDNLCTLYDRDKIRYLMSGIDISVHVCVQITFLLMIVIFKWEERKFKREEKIRTLTTDVEDKATTIQ